MSIDPETKQSPVPSVRSVELWPLVRYHFLMISFTTLVGVGFAYLYFLRTPPVFESKCQIFVRNESKNASIPLPGTEITNSTTRETPHALLINTPLIVDKALDKEVVTLATGDKAIRLRDLPFFSTISAPSVYITSKLGARPSAQGGSENQEIVNLVFRSSDAQLTKAVLDAIVDSYKDFLGESQKNVSEEVLDLIENARNSILGHLSSVEKEYAEFRHNMPLLMHEGREGSQTINLHKARMTEIESQRAKLLIVANQRRAELASIQNAIANGGNREAVALLFKSLKQESSSPLEGGDSSASEIFKLILEHQLLLEDLGSDHPKVRSLQKKIDLTRNFFESEASSDDKPKPTRRDDFVKVCLDALRYEINTIEAQATQLDELFEDERYSAKAYSSFEEKNDYYQKELERTNALYQRVMKRLDEINLLRDYGGYKTNVISPARVGYYVSPIFNQCLTIGAICGAAVGLALAYLIEANDQTFHSPDEVSEQLGLPVVGHVPVIQPDPRRIRSDTRLSKMLVTVFMPKSSVSESYRGVRSSLYFSTRGEQHKVIQVTSPNPGDGKTTLCANLAVSIAQSGKRVVIIDADFRRPKLHEIFGLEKSIGMSSVIAGEAELPDAIQATEVENLWGLPCGPRPPNPSELLTSRRFEELIEVLREQYDFVLIDTPPLLAVTDPGAVAARVDGVILAIRLSKRTRYEAIRATEMLTNVGANTLGVVINGSVTKSGTGYGRYSAYSGAYQYRYGSKYSYEANYGDDADSPAPVQSARRRRQRS